MDKELERHLNGLWRAVARLSGHQRPEDHPDHPSKLPPLERAADGPTSPPPAAAPLPDFKPAEEIKP